MTKEETYKQILDASENNEIHLLKLYPIIDKACEEMQQIIYSKYNQILKLKKHDILMRDKAHLFNKESQEKDKIIESNIKQIRELQIIIHDMENKK